MFFTLAVVGFGLSLIEFMGWGPRVEVFLDRVRVKSMQITLRNGEVNPKLTDLYIKVLGFSVLGFFGASLLITALLLPLLLILGKESVSGIMGSKGGASVMGVLVLGTLGVTVGLVAAYLIWCSVVALVADVLNRLHKFPRGVVGTTSFLVGAICFAGEFLPK